MTDFSLVSRSPLDGANLSFNGLRIAELGDRSLVSIAIPSGQQSVLDERLSGVFGCTLPAVGRTTLSELDNARFLGMARDQVFVMFDADAASDPVERIREQIGASAYLVDQSDSWVVLTVSGPNCECVLERICPLDLHFAAFPVDSVARTMMEHHAAIIVRIADDHFLLLSPRSSAKSFMHTVEVSARNAID